MRIADVRVGDGHLLTIVADDGRVGTFDVSPYLDCEVFQPLRNPIEFRKVHNRSYYIEWSSGADLSADTLEARWTPAPPCSDPHATS
jgi:hypothetical protein